MVRRQGGYTLVEVMVVAALLVPMLGVAIAAGRTTLDSMNTNSLVAETRDEAMRAMHALERVLRPASRASLETRDATTGEWHRLPDTGASTSLRFRAHLDGTPAVLSSPVTTVAVEAAAAGPDAGKLVLQIGDRRTSILSGVASCTFERDGALLRVRLICVRQKRGALAQQVVLTRAIRSRNE